MSEPKAPTPVEVKNIEPLQVEIADDEPFHPVLNPGGRAPTPPEMVTKGEGKTLSPTTTEEGDRVTAGQRSISLLWESVQGSISIAITIAVIYCQIYDIDSETLNNAFFFVIATYLQRTNHTRVGGVGPVYRGR